jgi:hypothetical protein
VGLLLATALRVCWAAKRESEIRIEFVAVAPKVLALFYCLWLLLRYFYGGIFAVWFVTFLVTAIVLRWHFVTRRVFGWSPPPASSPVKPQRQPPDAQST